MTNGGHISAGTLDELEERSCKVVTGAGHTVAVFRHDGRVYAVDNRCPHMGFPLERGTVKDGILTWPPTPRPLGRWTRPVT